MSLFFPLSLFSPLSLSLFSPLSLFSRCLLSHLSFFPLSFSPSIISPLFLFFLLSLFFPLVSSTWTAKTTSPSTLPSPRPPRPRPRHTATPGNNETQMNWRSARTSFLERRIHLIESGLWTDCIFTIGPERIQYTAHKLLLAMASPVFEDYFFQANQRSNDPLHLADVDPGAFKKLLQFIYSDNVVMDNYKEAREVHRVAMKFAMTDLETKSLRRIKETVTFETACNMLGYSQFVERKYGTQHGKPLAERALEIIIRDTSRILLAPSFNEITIATLEEILRIDELHVNSELELINAVLQWATANTSALPLTTESLRALAAPALRRLRLLTLTSRQVVESVAGTPLLSNAECLAVLTLVAVPPPGPVRAPAAFSACRQPRGAAGAHACHAHCPACTHCPAHCPGHCPARCDSPRQ